ncbi:MAG TPA: D-alanyl-D-alanine carboxypeptidase [Firmicutes bacterium]|nr:D-alanyl-D-alanine carboxypeptidase [Bacillota bacterium]
MRIICFLHNMKSWRWIWIGLGLIVVITCFKGLEKILPVESDYQRINKYPSLVYLPDYTTGPKIYASAAILVEAVSGMILYAKNEHQQRAPASTTKIMTAIVCLEKGKLDDIVIISPKAAGTGGSSLWLKAGEMISFHELLEGVLLRSGNDGCVALAEHVAGSEQGFVRLMNRKAKEIGALNSNFRNTHGLTTPNHYTTAFDLAQITRYGFAHPEFSRIVGAKEEAIEWYLGEKSRIARNTNRLLWSFAGADGVKTGTTSRAGYCLVASATRDGRKFIAVVLNSPDRWGESARLLEYGFSNFSLKLLCKADTPVTEVKIRQGAPSVVSLYPRRDLMVVIPKGKEGEAQKKVILDYGALIPPVKAGASVGKISFYYQGQEVEWVELFPMERVQREYWWNRFFRRK